MAYGDKYRDPRWKKKEAQILRRDGYACRRCSKAEGPVAVHHWIYNGDPWEAPAWALVTLCDGCHNLCDEIRRECVWRVAEILAAADHQAWFTSPTVPAGGDFISWLTGALMSGEGGRGDD